MGLLSAGLLKVFDNVNFMQNAADAGVEETEFKREVRMIIDNPDHCSQSLLDANGAPLTFDKTSIDNPDAGEGLPMSLYMKAAPNGRTLKFSTDPEVTKRYKKLKITSIVLAMDSQNGGVNYPASPKSTDIGKIIFTLKKKAKDIKFSFPLVVEIGTDAQGHSTLKTCRTLPESNPCEALSMKFDAATGKCRYPTVTPSNTTLNMGGMGIWGGEGPEEICPENMRACGIQHKGEDNQQGGDDTALNGIKLLCCQNNIGITNVKEIGSYIGPFGDWRSQAFCPMGSYIRGFNHKWEGDQGSGDDTASNGVSVICSDSAGTVLNPWQGPFGNWQSNFVSCQIGEYVCGLKTKVEGNQNGGDDTGMNGLSMRCCSVEGETPSGNYPISTPNTTGSGAGGGGGGGCFVAGTQISLKNGSKKNIENVQLNEELVDQHGNLVYVKALKSYDYQGKIYSINGNQAFFTPNHPFLTLTGWKSLDPVKSMEESPGLVVTKLKVGDVLVKSYGLEPLLTLDFTVVQEKVYNFTVTGEHVYIADEYVVHNLKEMSL